MLSNPTLDAHGRQLCARRRLRWAMVATAIANIALWSVVFGL
ncbi:hypothetical protein [Caulobacter sp. DWR2-3-1b2]